MVAAVGFEPTPPKRLVPQTSWYSRKRGSSVVMGRNTTTSALLYKHAFMATWLEWWTVVAS